MAVEQRFTQLLSAPETNSPAIETPSHFNDWDGRFVENETHEPRSRHEGNFQALESGREELAATPERSSESDPFGRSWEAYMREREEQQFNADKLVLQQSELQRGERLEISSAFFDAAIVFELASAYTETEHHGIYTLDEAAFRAISPDAAEILIGSADASRAIEVLVTTQIGGEAQQMVIKAELLIDWDWDAPTSPDETPSTDFYDKKPEVMALKPDTYELRVENGEEALYISDYFSGEMKKMVDFDGSLAYTQELVTKFLAGEISEAHVMSLSWTGDYELLTLTFEEGEIPGQVTITTTQRLIGSREEYEELLLDLPDVPTTTTGEAFDPQDLALAVLEPEEVPTALMEEEAAEDELASQKPAPTETGSISEPAMQAQEADQLQEIAVFETPEKSPSPVNSAAPGEAPAIEKLPQSAGFIDGRTLAENKEPENFVIRSLGEKYTRPQIGPVSTQWVETTQLEAEPQSPPSRSLAVQTLVSSPVASSTPFSARIEALRPAAITDGTADSPQPAPEVLYSASIAISNEETGATLLYHEIAERDIAREGEVPQDLEIAVSLELPLGESPSKTEPDPVVTARKANPAPPSPRPPSPDALEAPIAQNREAVSAKAREAEISTSNVSESTRLEERVQETQLNAKREVASEALQLQSSEAPQTTPAVKAETISNSGVVLYEASRTAPAERALPIRRQEVATGKAERKVEEIYSPAKKEVRQARGSATGGARSNAATQSPASEKSTRKTYRPRREAEEEQALAMEIPSSSENRRVVPDAIHIVGDDQLPNDLKARAERVAQEIVLRQSEIGERPTPARFVAVSDNAGYSLVYEGVRYPIARNAELIAA